MDDRSPPNPYAEIGPTSRINSAPSTISRMPDVRTMRVITELGLRYRPLASADQEDHQSAVLLLARDVEHLNPDLLKAAADRWARESRYMPKACELIDMVRLINRKSRTGEPDLHAIAANANANANCTRPDLIWVVRNNDLRLEHR